MPKTATRIGPQDNGRRMSLDEFEFAEGREGYLYELSRGIVTVVNVPKPGHFAQVDAIRNECRCYAQILFRQLLAAGITY